MNDLIPGCSVKGKVMVDGEDVNDDEVDVVDVRKRIGMVFQKPNPFPKSIYENVAYGPRLHGVAETVDGKVRRRKHTKAELDGIRRAFPAARGPLGGGQGPPGQSGPSLSGGLRQRLCIAGPLAVGPEIILFDEPLSALDPIATAQDRGPAGGPEEGLHRGYRTHSMQQAARISDKTPSSTSAI